MKHTFSISTLLLSSAAFLSTITVPLYASSSVLDTSSPIGYWLQAPDFKGIGKYGTPQSVVQITETKNGTLQGKVLVDISGNKKAPLPQQYCKQDNCDDYCHKHSNFCISKNDQIELTNMIFMHSFKKDDDQSSKNEGHIYKSGHIFDSDINKSFDATLQTKQDGKLLTVDASWMWFHHSQTWTRLKENDAKAIVKRFSDCNEILWNQNPPINEKTKYKHKPIVSDHHENKQEKYFACQKSALNQKLPSGQDILKISY